MKDTVLGVFLSIIVGAVILVMWYVNTLQEKMSEGGRVALEMDRLHVLSEYHDDGFAGRVAAIFGTASGEYVFCRIVKEGSDRDDVIFRLCGSRSSLSETVRPRSTNDLVKGDSVRKLTKEWELSVLRDGHWYKLTSTLCDEE